MWRQIGTYDPLENEENVAFILKKYPMKLVPIQEEFRFGKKGLDNCGLTPEQCQWRNRDYVIHRMVQRYNMTEQCNSIGFFISKFEKTGEYRGFSVFYNKAC